MNTKRAGIKSVTVKHRAYERAHGEPFGLARFLTRNFGFRPRLVGVEGDWITYTKAVFARPFPAPIYTD